ncbi:DUF4840 domain-containing protein [uncultured Duncaniella sp.]|uniref:DUF4840 domain-containing protein n=1 Tax=uncultured Duncaniella sp. TaxID=2768039 RepID=UPI00272A8F3D|nr:DUF4840 domain-containing protein [uncultured Duncaniella sp.]
MKTITSIVLFIILVFITSCNNDEPRFSPSEIQNALIELKGTYHGKMRVSYYQGNTISEGNACKAVSKDSLTIYMDLTPMASVITDESVASRLRDIGVVQVKAAYDFLQMDNVAYHFALLPDDVICLGGSDVSETVKIVFSQIFGGDADYHYHNIIFNLSPTELWVGDKKYEPFQQLVYHYEGTYE